MARNDRKQQKRAERKKAKREAKRRVAINAARMTEKLPLDAVGKWPLHECLMSREWRDTAQLTQILVSRRSPGGKIAAACFLVDLACLGVKLCSVHFYPSAGGDYRSLCSMIRGRQPAGPCDLDLAAKVILAGRDYAASLGFEPDRDIGKAMKVLGDAHPENCEVEVMVGGPEGKPLYINGPHDNVQKVVNTLNRTVGEGNYDFLIGGPQEENRGRSQTASNASPDSLDSR